MAARHSTGIHWIGDSCRTWRILLLSLVPFLTLPSMAEDGSLFQNVVRPILARNCFECHGPDAAARKADLRLDQAEAAYADRDGSRAIVPGDPALSAIVQRMTTSDPDDRMPPPESHKTLSEEEIETIREWIREGAEYAEHWAFVPPTRAPVPAVQQTDWPATTIDSFILARLESEDLEPSPEADRYALIRRLYLDLLGVVPPLDEVDTFLADQKPGAYERLVDRLLASPRYGERWARAWLDLARYSDTNGYEKDRERSIWPYRDWVIDALNSDLPYDQFTVEQLAGDMLPNATLSQRIATGFHRNTMLNEEGGIDPLEYRFYAMVDRVATTGTVWLGLTVGCAQCHSHKYDPISHTEYYSLMALLNNAEEPDLLLREAETQVDREKRERLMMTALSRVQAQYPLPEGTADSPELRRAAYYDQYSQYMNELRAGLVPWTPITPTEWEANLTRLEVMDDGSVFASGDATKRDVYQLTYSLEGIDFPVAAIRLEALPDDRLPQRGPGRAFYEGRKGDFFLSEFTVRHQGVEQQFADGSRSYGKISVGSGNGDAKNVFDGEGSTGWSTSGREGETHYLVLNFSEPIQGAESLGIEMVFERHFVASLGRFRVSVAGERGQAFDLNPRWESAFGREHVNWTTEEDQAVQLAFIRSANELEKAAKSLPTLRERSQKYATTMVMRERPEDFPRQTTRHHRGEYLSPRETVSPGIPAVLQRSGAAPNNRLELAQWLVGGANPLVERVTVNRAWRAFFGTGLLETSGDFGTQSNQPSHPELLDWLAVEFRESGWSLKRLHRLIVMSRTYRQSSSVTPGLLARDPANRLLARGPRYRLEGELVRDALLSASGLLSSQMHGPSVRPPQPAAVTALAYGGTRWNAEKGESRYRRSLYTFSKRTAPFAAFTVFDAPSGENCTARRNRSNTPLQALTLLNDDMFIEFARALAARVVQSESGESDRIVSLFRHVLTRPPSAEAVQWLSDYRLSQRDRLTEGELVVSEVLGKDTNDPDLASWVMVARVVMNLDEAVNK